MTANNAGGTVLHQIECATNIVAHHFPALRSESQWS
jgi:hypothetical protein